MADYTVIDGMSVVILGRVLGLPLKRAHRLAMLDSLGPIFAEAAQKDWRIFHLGNTQEVAREGAKRLCARYPGLQIVAEQGFFDATPGSADNRRIIERIHDYRPHILLVGMGMPRQEQWIVEHVHELSGMVIFHVGAFLGYVAGDIATPPRWIGQIGLEWFFRLCSEPQRLGRRYLVEPWLLLRLILQENQQKVESREDSGL
jgi:N-acetylglucosaminyldiphosphoundecaprenol N-acetyl-beta-D-mannosaminyltransferase